MKVVFYQNVKLPIDLYVEINTKKLVKLSPYNQICVFYLPDENYKILPTKTVLKKFKIKDINENYKKIINEQKSYKCIESKDEYELKIIMKKINLLFNIYNFYYDVAN